jgi:succinate dehydrogenase flavin-adding protein (antitoxin of CptAB toxin-antitoxin module)
VGKDYLLKNFMEHIVHLQFEDDLQNLVSLLNGYQQTWLEFFIANSEREPLETVFSDFLDMNKKYARKGSRPVTDRELYYWLSGNRDNENGNLINLCDDLCDSMEKMTYPVLVSVLLDENAEIQRPIFHKPPKWSMISRKKPKEKFEVWAVPTYGLKKKLFGLHDRLESLFGWLSEVKDAESFPKIVMVITNQWQPGAIDRHLENIFKWRDKDIDFKFMLAQESGLGLTQIPVGF